MPIPWNLESLGANSPCKMMLKRWIGELGNPKAVSAMKAWLQALLASVHSEIDSQNRQEAEHLDTDTEKKVEHATALRLQAALALPRLQ